MTALCAGAVSSAMFNDRGKFQVGAAAASRGQRVGSLYAQHAAKVQRLARHASGDVEDACQVAWERLIVHDDVKQRLGMDGWLWRG